MKVIIASPQLVLLLYEGVVIITCFTKKWRLRFCIQFIPVKSCYFIVVPIT